MPCLWYSRKWNRMVHKCIFLLDKWCSGYLGDMRLVAIETKLGNPCKGSKKSPDCKWQVLEDCDWLKEF